MIQHLPERLGELVPTDAAHKPICEVVKRDPRVVERVGLDTFTRESIVSHPMKDKGLPRAIRPDDSHRLVPCP